MSEEELKLNNIIKRSTSACKCNNKSFIYLLPVKLLEDIVKFLSPIGTPSFNFKETSILRIETPEVSITGVRRLKEIRLTLKKETNLLDVFENALIKYVNK